MFENKQTNKQTERQRDKQTSRRLQRDGLSTERAVVTLRVFEPRRQAAAVEPSHAMRAVPIGQRVRRRVQHAVADRTGLEIGHVVQQRLGDKNHAHIERPVVGESLADHHLPFLDRHGAQEGVLVMNQLHGRPSAKLRSKYPAGNSRRTRNAPPPASCRSSTAGRSAL